MADATFNPARGVMALQDGGTVIIAATARAACEQATRCLAFPPTPLLQSGSVQTWLP